MSKLIKQLGRATRVKSAAVRRVITGFNPETGAPIEKIANIGRTLGSLFGGLADDAVRGGANLVGRGFAQKGITPKLLTAGGIGLGLGAANEGLAAANMPHFRFDDSAQWSPEVQPIRNRLNRGLGDHIQNLFTRPVQYTMFSNGPIGGPEQYMSKKLPSWMKTKINKLGPNGTADMSVSGTGPVDLDPTVARFLQEMMGDNQLMRAQGWPGAGPQTQQIQPKSYQFYNDRPGTGFSASSTF